MGESPGRVELNVDAGEAPAPLPGTDEDQRRAKSAPDSHERKPSRVSADTTKPRTEPGTSDREGTDRPSAPGKPARGTTAETGEAGVSEAAGSAEVMEAAEVPAADEAAEATGPAGAAGVEQVAEQAAGPRPTARKPNGASAVGRGGKGIGAGTAGRSAEPPGERDEDAEPDGSARVNSASASAGEAASRDGSSAAVAAETDAQDVAADADSESVRGGVKETAAAGPSEDQPDSDTALVLDEDGAAAATADSRVDGSEPEPSTPSAAQRGASVSDANAEDSGTSPGSGDSVAAGPASGDSGTGEPSKTVSAPAEQSPADPAERPAAPGATAASGAGVGSDEDDSPEGTGTRAEPSRSDEEDRSAAAVSSGESTAAAAARSSADSAADGAPTRDANPEDPDADETSPAAAEPQPEPESDTDGADSDVGPRPDRPTATVQLRVRPGSKPTPGDGPKLDEPTRALRLRGKGSESGDSGSASAQRGTDAGPTPPASRSAAASTATDADAATRLGVASLGAAGSDKAATTSTDAPAASAGNSAATSASATKSGSAGTAEAPSATPAGLDETARWGSSSALLPGASAARPSTPFATVVTAPPPDTPETTSEAMDVLAALSRRPMTPFRRLLKRVYIWGVFFAFIAIVLGAVQLIRPLPTPRLKLTAASSYTFPGSAPSLAWPTDGQGTIEVEGLGSLGHSGADDPVPIASVTKVMTAYLILRDHPLSLGQQGPTLTVDAQAASDYTTGEAGGESVVRVTDGEQISEYQALQMLLIPSANNVARLLGRWDAGSDAAFVHKMQAEASVLGMSKTTYTDPSGLTNTTRSTADDQLKLARMVMQNPVFRQIVDTPSFTPPGDGVMYNNNAVLGQNGIIGVKTGSSTSALGCLMFAAEQQVGGSTRLLLGVVVGQPATSGGSILQNALSASRQLVAGAEGVLQSHVLLKKGDVVGYVDDGLGGKTPLVATQDVTVAGWAGLSVPVSLEPSGSSVPHTGNAGQSVGTLVVGTGSGRTEIPVALGGKLSEPSFGSRLIRLA